MPELPLVSIGAINYNNSPYVIQTLDSIKQQTYGNIELIIVDDCSTDDSDVMIANWLKSYEGKYKFIRHETNKGVCAASNSVLKNASGKYFSYIGTDDTLLPEKIERQVEILEKTTGKVAAVYSDAYLMDEHGVQLEGLFIQRHRQFSQIPSGNLYETLLTGNFLPAMTLLLKRTVFDETGGFDEHLAYEDYDMWLRIAKKYEIIFSDFICVNYRIRPGSLSTTIRNWDYSNVRIFQKHVDAPLPVHWLQDIAYHAYSADDASTLALIRPFAETSSDRSLIAVYLLWRYNIPFSTGQKVLGHIKAHIHSGLSPLVLNATEQDVTIFLNEIAYSLPLYLLKEIATEAFEQGNEPALLLIKALADKTNSRYLKVAWLLWLFRMPCAVGKAILDSISQEDEPVCLQEDGKDDAGIFLNDIFPLLPHRSIEEIAREAFTANNEATLALLYQLGIKTNDLYLKATWCLPKIKSFPELNEAVLDYLRHAPVKPSAAGYDDPEKVFYDEILRALPLTLLANLADRAFAADNEGQITILNTLAQKKGSTYVITAWWLWKLRISDDLRAEALSSIPGDAEIGGGAPEAGTADLAFFLRAIVPAIPASIMKRMLIKAYAEDNIEQMKVFCALAVTSGDRYVCTVYLLWHFRILPATGAEILRHVEEQQENGHAGKMGIVYVNEAPDTRRFYNEVIAALPVVLQVRVADEAYFFNNRRMKPVLQYMAVKTRSQHYKTLVRLWHFNVNDYTGRIILSRIEQYCGEKRGSIYIALCLYKDIFGALRTGNASFAGSK